MVHCTVMGCKSRSERKIANVTFHSFPRDLETRQIWIQATGRSNWEPTKYDSICSRHFIGSCFRKTKFKVYLHAFSVPIMHINITKISDSITATKVQQMEVPVLASSSGLVECSKTLANNKLDVDKIKPLMDNKTPTTSSTSVALDIDNNMDQIPSVPTQATISIVETTLTPRKKELVAKLNRLTFLAKSRQRKLAALRSKCRRVEKKNAELSAIIKEMQSKHGHK